jgi:hypothetical protein
MVYHQLRPIRKASQFGDGGGEVDRGKHQKFITYRKIQIEVWRKPELNMGFRLLTISRWMEVTLIAMLCGNFGSDPVQSKYGTNLQILKVSLLLNN